MPDSTCSVVGCDKPRKSKRRMCSMHVARWDRTGTTDPGPIAQPKLFKYWQRVDLSNPEGCWRWTGTHHTAGYGLLGSEYAHRYAWYLHTGEKVPDGMHIDHKCFVRDCVNPLHLQVVTLTENNQNHQGARRNSKTGIRGVSWCKAMKKWSAVAQHNGVVVREYFDDIDDAAAAVVEIRNRLHTNNLIDRQHS